MNQMKNTIIISAIILLAFSADAQSIEKNVTASGGKTYTVGSIALEFTVGEVFTNTLNTAGNSITQGFHQPNLFAARMMENENGELQEVSEEQITVKLSDKTLRQFDAQVFPNPTTDYLNLKLNSTEFENPVVTVSTFDGKLLSKSAMTSESTQIDFTSLSSGTYIVKIQNEKGDISNTYKVVKTK